MALDWKGLIQSEGFSNIMRLVHLSFRMDSQHQEAIRAELVRTRRRQYEASLTELAESAGCDRSALLSEGPILSELNEMSKTDAESIVNTYNYDLGLAIIAIKEETPTANRNVYAKRLGAWETQRAGWKDLQIATNTNLTARQQAQRDFFKNNLVEATVKLIGPDPAAEPVCQAALDMGRVPVEVANEMDFPAHLNCVHTFSDYKIKKLDKGKCAELWMGQ
jgi:hypothetical protein